MYIYYVLICNNCFKNVNRQGGKKKIIGSQRDAMFFGIRLKKHFHVGNIICGRCRLQAYKAKERAIADSRPSSSTHLQSANDSLSSESVAIESEYTSDEGIFFHINKKSDVVEVPLRRVVSTHAYCFICGGKNNLQRVHLELRCNVYKKTHIYIPDGNRCCRSYLIGKNFYEDDLSILRVVSSTSSIASKDLVTFFDRLSINEPSSLFAKIIGQNIPEDHLKVLCGLCWLEVLELSKLLTSMRNSSVGTIVQALVIFLFKLRSGNSNTVIATVFGLQFPQQVSTFCKEVIKSFEVDVLPLFGFNKMSREDLLSNTTLVARKLLNVRDNQLVLICDGTYIRHQKSSNNAYQRKSYSGQKKVHLCKPFTICTTNGFILDFFGPFVGTMNDAEIMKKVLESPALKALLRPNDIFVLDRGFRDVVNYIKEKGYIVYMPALKGNRAQLPTNEANISRQTTKIRWVVEAVHGAIAQKYRLLHHNLDNKSLLHIKPICKIVAFLQNRFGKRLSSDGNIADTIVNYMQSRMELQNTLNEEVQIQSWNRKKTKLQKLNSSMLLDFPRLNEDQLRLLFTGSYQMRLAVCYLAEILDEQNNIDVFYVKETPNILKLDVRSRHINSKHYRVYIDYVSGGNDIKDIKRYCCDCANGLRTVGCCAHVSCIIYYLSYARYLSRIVRPAEILVKMFSNDNIDTVINENSDDDE